MYFKPFMQRATPYNASPVRHEVSATLMNALQIVEFETYAYDWSTLPGGNLSYNCKGLQDKMYKNESMSNFTFDYWIDPSALSGGDRHKFVMIGNYTGFRQPGFTFPRLKMFSTGDQSFRPHIFPGFNLAISHSKDNVAYWDHIHPCDVVNTCSWVSYSDAVS